MKRLLFVILVCMSVGLVGCGQKYSNMDDTEKMGLLQGTYEPVIEEGKPFVISENKLTYIDKKSDYEIDYMERNILFNDNGFVEDLDYEGAKNDIFIIIEEDYIKRDRDGVMYKKVSDSTILPEVKQTGGDPEIGMTKEDVELSSWGKPKDTNKTTTEYGVREQWVYDDNRYIYFEDGIVTTMQE